MKKRINTNGANWLEEALHAYEAYDRFEINDEAGIGFSADDLGSREKLQRAVQERERPAWQRICAGIVGASMIFLGGWMIVEGARRENENVNNDLLILEGATLILTGGAGAMMAFGNDPFIATPLPGGNRFKVERNK